MSLPDATAQQSEQPQEDAGTAQHEELPDEYAPQSRLRIRPSLQGVLAVALYAAVWLPTVVRPLVSHLGRAQLVQFSPDPNFYVWSLGWWPYALGHGQDPLYSNLILAPAGHSLAWVATVPPLALLTAPLSLTAGPVAAFNLLTALALPLSAWAAFVACRRLTGRFWPALVGGAVYGFSVYELGPLGSGQLNLCVAVLPPLLAYLVLAWRDGSIGWISFVILAGLVLAAQYYLFLETFADLTVILAVSVVLGLLLARRGSRRRLAQLAGLLALAYGVALALAAPDLAVVLATPRPKPPSMGALDLASLVLPRPGHSLGIAGLAHADVGIPLLIVLVALAATRWRSRLVWFLAALFAVVTIAALGPVLRVDGSEVAVLPWHGLWGLPFVRSAYPRRLMLFDYLVLALAAALLLAGEPWRRHPGRWRAVLSVAARCALGALVLAFLVPNASEPLTVTGQTTVPVFISNGEYRSQLTRGEVVIVVSEVRNAGMLWQAQSGFYWRLAGGFINAGFEHRSDLPPLAEQLQWANPGRINQFEYLVRADHIGAILVDAGHPPDWAGVFGIFGLTGHRDGGVIVYPTSDCRSCRAVSWKEIVAAHVRPS